jgi:YVTN family beta-propeller protein
MARHWQTRSGRHRVGAAALLVAVAGLVALSVVGHQPRVINAQAFGRPTYSSPIALSQDDQLVWVVNPDNDTVSVIRTDTNALITSISVGNEPQGVALTPDNQYAYVANTADSSVTVIRITNASPAGFQAAVDTTVGPNGSFRTGADPFNIVVSPDGQRVFVANSGQDTITVINAATRTIIGHVDVRRSVCNDPDRNRHFQPRGMAITQDNTRLYVTRFLSFVKSGGRQADDDGKEGGVCRININTGSTSIGDYQPAQLIPIGSRVTGFMIDRDGDGTADPTSAFPNQMQSIVIRGNQAYLPNIAASPSGPLRFNVDTHAFINVLDNVATGTPADASQTKFVNANLGARNPEAGKPRLFFSNQWAIAFTNQAGPTAFAYSVSAGSDLLVKLTVAADGALGFTVDGDTTRYIDLNDPGNPATAEANAGKNPKGIVINSAGTHAYVQNFVSRNVSVVDLTTDAVVKTIITASQPAPGSQEEVVQVGADMFFSSRGVFSGPQTFVGSHENRLSSEGWQACASCHPDGLTDGVVWAFGVGPRKSVPLNTSFNPNSPSQQRVLNYSAIFDEIEDFELNVRNVSGPGALGTAVPCSDPPPGTSTFNRDQGLILGDTDVNLPPCTINAFQRANANRQQVTVRIAGSNVDVPAMTALREWIRLAIRTPTRPLGPRELLGGVDRGRFVAGLRLFKRARCHTCHGTSHFTVSMKDFTSPPPNSEISVEVANATFGTQAPAAGTNPVNAQYLPRFLRDIGSFNLGVLTTAAGGFAPGNCPPWLSNVCIGGIEKTGANPNAQGQVTDALGIDYNGDGRGTGYNPPSLLGIRAMQPYYHNGACETLACVVADPAHRTAGLPAGAPDPLVNPRQQQILTRFLEAIDTTFPSPDPAGGPRGQ